MVFHCVIPRRGGGHVPSLSFLILWLRFNALKFLTPDLKDSRSYRPTTLWVIMKMKCYSDHCELLIVANTGHALFKPASWHYLVMSKSRPGEYHFFFGWERWSLFTCMCLTQVSCSLHERSMGFMVSCHPCCSQNFFSWLGIAIKDVKLQSTFANTWLVPTHLLYNWVSYVLTITTMEFLNPYPFLCDMYTHPVMGIRPWSSDINSKLSM